MCKARDPLENRGILEIVRGVTVDERRTSGRAIEVLCGQEEIYPSKYGYKVVVEVRMTSALTPLEATSTPLPTRSVTEFSHSDQVTQEPSSLLLLIVGPPAALSRTCYCSQ